MGLGSLARFSSHALPFFSPPSFHTPFPFPRVHSCGGQTSPHKSWLVVSHSTCPPLSSSPHAHSFVIGTAVINNNNPPPPPPGPRRRESTSAAAAPSKFTQVSVVTTCPSHPSHGGVARDGNGNVIVTDRHRIRKVSPDGSVSTLAGSGRLRRRPPAGRRRAFFLHVPWQWMATSSSQTTAKHGVCVCGTVSSDIQSVFLFFASQSHHKYKKKILFP